MKLKEEEFFKKKSQEYKLNMTINQIGNYFYELQQILESGELSADEYVRVVQEHNRWGNVYTTIRERYIKRYGFLKEDEVIDKYSINKINSEFE